MTPGTHIIGIQLDSIDCDEFDPCLSAAQRIGAAFLCLPLASPASGARLFRNSQNDDVEPFQSDELFIRDTGEFNCVNFGGSFLTNVANRTR